jgi:hypothetical protein
VFENPEGKRAATMMVPGARDEPISLLRSSESIWRLLAAALSRTSAWQQDIGTPAVAVAAGQDRSKFYLYTNEFATRTETDNGIRSAAPRPDAGRDRDGWRRKADYRMTKIGPERCHCMQRGMRYDLGAPSSGQIRTAASFIGTAMAWPYLSTKIA